MLFKKLMVIFCVSIAVNVSANSVNSVQLTQVQQKEVLKQLNQIVSTNYVKESQLKSLSNFLEKELKKSDREKADAEKFASTLTAKLQQVSNDQHLRIDFFPHDPSANNQEQNEEDFSSEFERDMWESQNMGFDQLSRLPFNIGYLKLSAFAPIKEASPLLSASFRFLNHSDALILDLRENFGGYEHTGVLLTSYLIDKKTHLFDMHHRQNNLIEQRWSLAKVDGPKYSTEKPVYILVDQHTFSAGETLAYTLKHLGRVKIVGEKTAGASNAGREFSVGSQFKAFIPTKKMVNISTKGSFENVGVKPHIESKSNNAMAMAQIDYLKNVYRNETDENRRSRIKRRLSVIAPK